MRGSARGIEVLAQSVEPRARLTSIDTRDGRISIEISVEATATAAEAPPEAQFMKLSTATGFVFDTSPARLGR